MDRRLDLELRVIDAVVALAEDMGCDAFALPVPGSDPRVFVCWGSAETLGTLLGSSQPTTVADAHTAGVANDSHA